MTPEQLDEARKRAATGTIPRDEMKEIIKFLRQDRISASFASKKAKSRKKAEDTEEFNAMNENLFEGLFDEPGTEGEEIFDGL